MKAAEGKIVTFYSYKGGTGRSMALANIAWILASNGKRVLAIDWDLEAPGLHRYFAPFLRDKDLTSSDGLIDLVVDYASEAMTPVEKESTHADTDIDEWLDRYVDPLAYVVSLEWQTFPERGTLDLLPAGRQGRSYASRVNSFGWQDFYGRLGGKQFFETMKAKLRRDYDYVLIDSRTGVSDTSGICTVQMPDDLVVCFTLNIQSIDGAAAVARSVRERRPDLRILPVPTRVELAEKQQLEEMRSRARESFAPLMDGGVGQLRRSSGGPGNRSSYKLHAPRNSTIEDSDDYWGNVEVLYVPFYAYREVLSPFVDSPGQSNSLLAAHECITGHLSDGEVTRFRPSVERSFRDDFLQDTRKTERVKGVEAVLRERPELTSLAEQIREAGLRWESHKREPQYLLPPDLVRSLERQRDLLAAFLESQSLTFSFGSFWARSVERSKRRAQKRRRLLLATYLGLFVASMLVAVLLLGGLGSDAFPDPHVGLYLLAALGGVSGALVGTARLLYMTVATPELSLSERVFGDLGRILAGAIAGLAGQTMLSPLYVAGTYLDTSIRVLVMSFLLGYLSPAMIERLSSLLEVSFPTLSKQASSESGLGRK